MKKFLAFTLVLTLLLALCACGNAPADNGSKATNGTNAANGTNDPVGTTGSAAAESQETGYVGTWKAIAPDSNSFPPLYMVLYEDGTAGWGSKLDNLQPYFWYESEGEGHEGEMELAREDNMGYGNIFYLTEDGTIYMDINLSVGENSYDHIYFERQ